MNAFHKDKKIKAKYLSRVKAHAKADELIKGKYWENGKGCAVGCTIHSSDHLQYEIELGIPEWLARVEDRIFEGLENKYAMRWPTKFLEAIPLGVDLNQIKAPFMIFILKSTLDKFDHKKYPNVLKSIEDVIALYKNPLATREEFKKARAAAWSATAWSAANAAESATAWSAANAAESAAWSATHAYAAYADAAAAAAAHAYADAAAAYGKYADYLLKLLKACK